MTEEEKRLLFQDLVARVPYGVKCKVETCAPPATIASINDEGGVTVRLVDKNGMTRGVGWDYLADIKPYLRPIDTMTGDERGELLFLLAEGRTNIELNSNGQLITRDDVKLGFNYPFVCPQGSGEYIDFLNAHHFDYRGLIEKGLALKAPDGMYNGQND